MTAAKHVLQSNPTITRLPALVDHYNFEARRLPAHDA